MHSSYLVGALVGLAAWICPKAYAPIYGGYSGLNALIKESEIVAAVTIRDQLPEGDIGGSNRYKIEFTKVLKGSPPQKEAIAWLRYLEVTPQAKRLRSPAPTNYFAPTGQHVIQRGYRYVLFLVKSERGDGTPYENVNCEGSCFPISPLRDLGSLKVESLPDTLTLLFREYVDFKRSELKEFDQELDAFIHEGDK